MAAVMADGLSEDSTNNSEFECGIPFNSNRNDRTKFYIGENKAPEESSEEDVQNDLEVDSLQFQYGVTPPRNARRLKEKSKSCKKSKERTVVFSKSLSAKDLVSDAIFRSEQDIQRKKNRANSTQISNERAFQRKIKRESWSPDSSISASQSLSCRAGSKMEIPSYMIESRNRYMCLNYDLSQSYPNARSLRTINTDPMSNLCSQSSGGKFPLNPACPEPRVQFFRTFTKLVEMCVHSKQKENPSVAQMERQTSEENKRWEIELRQALWLELQAWHAGRTMPEQDDYLIQARKGIDNVLEEVINFRFAMPDLEDAGSSDTKNTNAADRENIDSQVHQLGNKEDKNRRVKVQMPNTALRNDFAAEQRVDENVQYEPQTFVKAEDASVEINCDNVIAKDSDCLVSGNGACCSFTKTFEYKVEKRNTVRPDTIKEQKHNICKETFSKQIQAACQQVSLLFDKLEKVEKLYPTTRALGEENSKYLRGKFQMNFETLCVWLNITKDLNHKLQTVAKIICIDISDEETWKDWLAIGLGRQCPVLNKKECSITDDNVTMDDVTSHQQPSDGSEVSRSHSSLGRSSSTMSQQTFSSTSRYRPFVNKSIKKMGLIKLGQRIRDNLDRSLLQANQALRLHGLQTKDVTEQMVKKRAASLHELETLLNRQESHSLTRTRVGSREWQKETFAAIEGFEEDFQELGLPSFSNLYLFLARIPLDITHECLRLRLEHRPKGDPSSLSVRQLLRECKEVILGAVLVKDYYLSLVEGVVVDKETFENDLDEFEHDLQAVFKVYYDYLHNVLHLLQRMPEASKKLTNVLEEEWNFVKERCQHIRGGEVEGGTRFCVMASGLLDSTGHFLESGLDQCCSDLHSDSEHGEDQRRKVLETCRSIKNLFNEARERASKALGFQKKLRNDMETAASYQVEVSASELLAQLEKTGHMQVLARHSAGLMMFVPKQISDDKSQIINLLNVCCGVEEVGPTARCNSYLLLLSVETVECGTDTPIWEGERVSVDPTVETAIGLADIQVGGLILVVSNSKHLETQCGVFQSAMESVVQPVKKRTSKHQAIAETLEELQNACLSLREGIVSAIERVDENLDVDCMTDMEEIERNMLHQNYIETMHSCFNFGFEYHKELNRIVSGESHDKLARDMLMFARKWMTFVTTKCRFGTGFRPRWVHQGLEFLTLACDPNTVLSVLPEAEYQDLMKQMNDCIGHMKMGNSPKELLGQGLRPQSPLVAKSPPSLQRPGSWPSNKAVKSDHESEDLPHQSVSEPDRSSSVFEAISSSEDTDDMNDDRESEIFLSPKENIQSPSKTVVVGESRLESIRRALRDLENSRNQHLFDKRVIGRISSRHRDIASELANISNRRVPFKWQRGNKIGEGRFGKVYACVNLDSGDLMAMKQIKFHPNDHGEIRDLADEIKNFEGIHHESLVSYYGVELHRDEMFIFMEYCADGTIQDVAKLGLPEDMIRVYTAQILEAINVLHEHGIIHRDVKGANIFLSSGGSLIKLGDFGSSIKLKDPMHTMHGEISNIRGTVAYMAPEVITMDKGAGYGRASDIWSLGCVVVEMQTGKPPWPECDNNFAVMFKVGEGETPTIPDTLSEEGKDFLRLCFTFDARERPIASDLQDHPFVKCC